MPSWFQHIELKKEIETLSKKNWFLEKENSNLKQRLADNAVIQTRSTEECQKLRNEVRELQSEIRKSNENDLLRKIEELKAKILAGAKATDPDIAARYAAMQAQAAAMHINSPYSWSPGCGGQNQDLLSILGQASGARWG